MVRGGFKQKKGKSYSLKVAKQKKLLPMIANTEVTTIMSAILENMPEVNKWQADFIKKNGTTVKSVGHFDICDSKGFQPLVNVQEQGVETPWRKTKHLYPHFSP